MVCFAAQIENFECRMQNCCVRFADVSEDKFLIDVTGIRELRRVWYAY